jgi:hypothetical protein
MKLSNSQIFCEMHKSLQLDICNTARETKYKRTNYFEVNMIAHLIAMLDY